MAILTISNNHSSSEAVKVKEGDVWEIDRYTTKFRDSSDLRQQNQRLYQEFQSKYPNGGRGSISLFVTKNGEYKEWYVFYEKHLVAFKSIIHDQDFLDYYMNFGRSRNYFRNIKDFYKSLEGLDDRRESKLYFETMRDMVYVYLQYCKENKDVKSIDQLYEEYYRREKLMSRTSSPLQREPIEHRIFLPSNKEIDPDILIYDEMDRVESRYSILDSFLSNPHFERTYQDVLTDGYFFILGNSIVGEEQKEIYEKWYQYASDCFDGTVVCSALSKNTSSLNKLEQANIVMFCIFESDLDIEKSISMALINRSEVIIELYDSSLYLKYSKKYRQATIVLCGMQDEDTILDTTDYFIIDCYNHAKEKGYQKCEN